MNWRVKLACWLLKPYSHQMMPHPGMVPIIFADPCCLDFDDISDGELPCWVVPARRFGDHPLSDYFHTVYAPDGKEAV